jgi:hypothetical protein
VAAAVTIIAAGFDGFVFAGNGAALDSSGKAFVGDAAIAVTARWDPDELWKRASPQFKATVKQNDRLFGFDDLAPLTIAPE